MEYSRLIILLSLTAAFVASCTATTKIAEPTLQPTDPYYTSAFPVHDVSDQLEDIQKSLVRIASTGVYRTYRVADMNITEAQLDTLDLENSSLRYERFEETTAGTATVIAKSQFRAVLITNAHTIAFPDTIIKYSQGEEASGERFVETVTIKQNQTNVALTRPLIVSFEILDENEAEDLAIIGISLINLESDEIYPVNLAFGDSKNLRTGSLVYILGFPKGFPMVTQGVVSDPNRNKKGSYLTDALFNRGVSGGLIVSSKDNFQSFEWVGIANAGVATQDYYLVPDEDFLDTSEPAQLYEGPLIAEKKARLDYGITYAIPTSVISEFLNENRNRVRNLNKNLHAVFDN